MDLAKLDTVKKSNEGEWMTVLHPELRSPLVDDKGKEARIKIAGVDGEIARKASRENQQRRMSKRQISPEDLEEEGLHLLARLTLEWEGIDVDGETLECTYANAKLIYDRFRWLFIQVDAFSIDRGNYLGN